MSEKKIDVQGKQLNLKVDAETITLEMPNTKGLSLEEVDATIKGSDPSGPNLGGHNCIFLGL